MTDGLWGAELIADEEKSWTLSCSLRRAHDAGLRVEPDGDKLLVKGPRRAEAIVELLAIHNAEVLALLAQAGDAPPPIAGETSAAAEPSFWRDFFEERAAHREYDGRYPRIEAEQLAFGEAILVWHLWRGASPDRYRCAGCGEALPREVALILADGAHVHFGDIRGVKCIVKYGAKWRGVAVAALHELGLDPPDGLSYDRANTRRLTEPCRRMSGSDHGNGDRSKTVVSPPPLLPRINTPNGRFIT